jgi:hypothetical protein
MAELKMAEAKPKPAEKRHVHAIRIEIGKSGGHVVHHEMRGGNPEEFGGGEEKPHIFGKDDGEKLLDHIKKHAKIKIKEGEEEAIEDEKDSPKKSNKKHEEREEAHDEESDEDTKKESESEGDKAAH